MAIALLSGVYRGIFAKKHVEKTDTVHYEVSWKYPLSSLDGSYRLRFIMNAADLYSYTI